MSAWSIDPLLVGSEGTLGIITSAELVIRELSTERWYRGFKFPNVTSGVEGMRLIFRQGLRPDQAALQVFEDPQGQPSSNLVLFPDLKRFGDDLFRRIQRGDIRLISP